MWGQVKINHIALIESCTQGVAVCVNMCVHVRLFVVLFGTASRGFSQKCVVLLKKN